MDSYALKRDMLRGTGATWYRWRNLKPGLYVFNYHRIGDETSTRFDPNVFSCDEEHFDRQLATITSRFRTTTIREVVELADGCVELTEPLALITFDDGYHDNFTKAFPILKAHRTSAVFFLPTSYVGSTKVPWWDDIARMIRSTDRTNVNLLGTRVEIDRLQIKYSIRAALNVFKQSPASIGDKLEEFRAALGYPSAAEEDTLFVNWTEVREMRSAGMDIGSHTDSHRILAHLSEDDQLTELSQSKRILERELGEAIQSIAYPVGGPGTFTSRTEQLAAQCGYRVAFSFVSGVNRNLQAGRFSLRRMAVENNAGMEDIRFLGAFSGVNLGVFAPLRMTLRFLKTVLRRLRGMSGSGAGDVT